MSICGAVSQAQPFGYAFLIYLGLLGVFLVMVYGYLHFDFLRLLCQSCHLLSLYAAYESTIL
jgi:hypothetical protein